MTAGFDLPPAYLPSPSTLWTPSVPFVERHVPPDSHLNWLIRLARFLWVLTLLPLHAALVLVSALSPIPPPANWAPGSARRWSATQRLLYPPLGRLLWALTGIGSCPDVGDRWEYAVPLSTRVFLHQLTGGRASVEAETVELSGTARREGWVRAEAVDPTGEVVAGPVPCFWVEAKEGGKGRPGTEGGGAAASAVPPLTSGNARRRTRGGKVVLFLAGGGYVAGHPAEGGRCFSIALETGVPVFGCNYRKATHPSRAFPGALLDALAGYSHLVDLGFDHIVLAGDSAGGGLAITILLFLATSLAQSPQGAPPSLLLPAGCVIYSPWVDLTLASSCSQLLTQGTDDILNPSMLSTAARHYLSHLAGLPADSLAKQPTGAPARLLARHPFFSPALHSSLPALQQLAQAYPATQPLKWLIFSGSSELFAPEIRALVANLRRACPSGEPRTMELEVIEEKDEIHCYFMWPAWVSPGAGRALQRVGRFLESL